MSRTGRHGEAEDGEPMATLRQLMDAAKKVESAQVEIPSGVDPLQGLEELIERARREEEGEGGAALRRLEERIEAAREIPKPEAYRPQAGDPLEVLEARIRGDYEQDTDAEAEGGAVEERRPKAASVATAGGEARAEADGDRRAKLGAALEESLRRRPLSGELRAEVAARLAAVMDVASGEQIREIWELVVFGDGGL